MKLIVFGAVAATAVGTMWLFKKVFKKRRDEDKRDRDVEDSAESELLNSYDTTMAAVQEPILEEDLEHEVLIQEESVEEIEIRELDVEEIPHSEEARPSVARSLLSSMVEESGPSAVHSRFYSLAEEGDLIALGSSDAREEWIPESPHLSVDLGSSINASNFFDALEDLSRNSISEEGAGSPPSETQSMLDDWEEFQTSLGLIQSNAEDDLDSTEANIEGIILPASMDRRYEQDEPSVSVSSAMVEEGRWAQRVVLDLPPVELTSAEMQELQSEVDEILHNLRERRRLARRAPPVEAEAETELSVDGSEASSQSRETDEDFYGENFPEGPELSSVLLEIDEQDLHALRDAVRRAPLAANPLNESGGLEEEAAMDNERFCQDQLFTMNNTLRVVEEPEEEDECEPFDLLALVAEFEEEMEQEMEQIGHSE